MVRKAFKNVQEIRRRDGTCYYYHRPTKARLPDAYGSPEFAVAWAHAEAATSAKRTRTVITGTYEGLWLAFQEADEWKALKPRTQRDYEKVRDWMFKHRADTARAADLSQADAENILDAAVRETNHRFAVYVLQVNRRIYNWVLERSARKEIWGGENPWRDLKSPPKPRHLRKRKQNRAWLPEEVAIVLNNAPLGLARAYVLGTAGFDGSTMFNAKWSDYRNGAFQGEREKSGVTGFSLVAAPLRRFLDEGHKPSEYIITKPGGTPYATVNHLQTDSSRYISRLVDQGLVGTGLTMHGLRHTLGKALADGGASLSAIQTALRHSSKKMSLHYSEEADKKQALLDSASAVDDFFKL